jgi:hypothetical protein
MACGSGGLAASRTTISPTSAIPWIFWPRKIHPNTTAVTGLSRLIGIGRLSPVAVSAMSLLSPVTAVVLGWIFLGQKIRTQQCRAPLWGFFRFCPRRLTRQRALNRQHARQRWSG